MPPSVVTSQLPKDLSQAIMEPPGTAEVGAFLNGCCTNNTWTAFRAKLKPLFYLEFLKSRCCAPRLSFVPLRPATLLRCDTARASNRATAPYDHNDVPTGTRLPAESRSFLSEERSLFQSAIYPESRGRAPSCSGTLPSRERHHAVEALLPSPLFEHDLFGRSGCTHPSAPAACCRTGTWNVDPRQRHTLYMYICRLWGPHFGAMSYVRGEFRDGARQRWRVRDGASGIAGHLGACPGGARSAILFRIAL
jgi:hypothetical protein